MLNKTSVSAIRALLLLAGQQPRDPWPPRRIAEVLDESPTYMAKVVSHLVRAGLLDSAKGVKGGVRLVRPPAEIRMLDIVEACQGTIVGDYCRKSPPQSPPCAFHRAAVELHEAITGVLARWTLADLLAGPFGSRAAGGGLACLMAGVPPPLTRLPAGPAGRRS
jgi:Rrf2 family protein